VTNRRDGSIKRLVFDTNKSKTNESRDTSQNSDQNATSNEKSNELFNAFEEHNKENINFINKQS
jgi:hypothetical protein